VIEKNLHPALHSKMLAQPHIHAAEIDDSSVTLGQRTMLKGNCDSCYRPTYDNDV